MVAQKIYEVLAGVTEVLVMVAGAAALFSAALAPL